MTSPLTTENALTGANALLKGFAMLGKKGVRRFVAIPIALNICLFTLGLRSAWLWFEKSLTTIENALTAWLDFLTWLLWPLFVVALLLIIAYGFTFVANLIGSPFYGLLAERVEQLALGNDNDSAFSWRQLLASIPRAVLREAKKIIYYLLWLIPIALIWLFSLIFPILTPLTTALWFAFGAWIFALKYIDYAYDNHGRSCSKLQKDMRQQRMRCLS
ncbi:sulfate transporter CysZ, partial [bacterium]|nr:sulfate transporter CysZ [bacterium]